MNPEGREPAEVLQAVALEAIKAMRALLDVAETVVREPATATAVGKAFAEAAASAFRPTTLGDERDHEEDEGMPDDAHRGVRHIHLTD